MTMARSLDSSEQPTALTVVFDGECLLCRRSVLWLEERRQAVPIRTMPASSAEARARFGGQPDYGDDMIVADNLGRVWAGPPDAYLVVMWAIPLLRPLSYLLAVRQLRPLVRRVFMLVTGNRQSLSKLFDSTCERCATPSSAIVGSRTFTNEESNLQTFALQPSKD